MNVTTAVVLSKIQTFQMIRRHDKCNSGDLVPSSQHLWWRNLLINAQKMTIKTPILFSKLLKEKQNWNTRAYKESFMPSVVSFLKGQRKPNCEEGGGRREGKKKGGGIVERGSRHV